MAVAVFTETWAHALIGANYASSCPRLVAYATSLLTKNEPKTKHANQSESNDGIRRGDRYGMWSECEAGNTGLTNGVVPRKKQNKRWCRPSFSANFQRPD
jgi:hypothetical protein